MAVSGPKRAQGSDGGVVALDGRRHGFPGGEDRAVAGASAQIAGDHVADRHALRPQGTEASAVERHDEARRAEAALRAVSLDHLALDGVGAAEAFDGPKRLAVEHRE